MSRAGLLLAGALALGGCDGLPLDSLAPAADGPLAEAEPSAASELSRAAVEGSAVEAAAAGDSPPLPEPTVAPPAAGEAGPDTGPAIGQPPQIHMAIQPDVHGPISVVFAIDRSRDNTPSDEPAVRLTPFNGKCNPQELRRYNFPPESAAKPVFGAEEQAGGITARELPDFMAVAATAEMLRQGLITEPADSRPQNVCTRKLWELLILSQSAGIG